MNTSMQTPLQECCSLLSLVEQHTRGFSTDRSFGGWTGNPGIRRAGQHVYKHRKPTASDTSGSQAIHLSETLTERISAICRPLSHCPRHAEMVRDIRVVPPRTREVMKEATRGDKCSSQAAGKTTASPASAAEWLSARSSSQDDQLKVTYTVLCPSQRWLTAAFDVASEVTHVWI